MILASNCYQISDSIIQFVVVEMMDLYVAWQFFVMGNFINKSMLRYRHAVIRTLSVYGMQDEVTTTHNPSIVNTTMVDNTIV